MLDFSDGVTAKTGMPPAAGGPGVSPAKGNSVSGSEKTAGALGIKVKAKDSNEPVILVREQLILDKDKEEIEYDENEK